MASRRKLLIDVDTGVDDAQAIMMALASKDVDVLAITCVGGNTELDQVITNTLRVLKVCDRLDVSRTSLISITFPIFFNPHVIQHQGNMGSANCMLPYLYLFPTPQHVLSK